MLAMTRSTVGQLMADTLPTLHCYLAVSWLLVGHLKKAKVNKLHCKHGAVLKGSKQAKLLRDHK